MSKTFSKQTVNGEEYLVRDAQAREDISTLAGSTLVDRYILPSSAASLDSITENSIYLVGDNSTASNVPPAFEGKGFTLFTIKLQSNGGMIQQYAVGYNPLNSNRIFKRNYSNSTWGGWVEVTSMQTIGVLPDGSDLNDIKYQTIAFVQTGASHIPANYPTEFGNYAAFILTFATITNGTGTILVQFAISYFTNIIRKRYLYNGTWSNWGSLSEGFSNRGVLHASDDLDNLTDDAVYSVASVSPADQPEGWPMTENRAGFIVSAKALGSAGYNGQFILPYSGIAYNNLSSRKECAAYSRMNVGGSWSDWKYFKMVPRNAAGKYYAFGDSTTWGYSSDHNHAQSPWNYPAMVGDMIGVDVHNLADPAQGLIKDWTSPATTGNFPIIDTIAEMVSNGDFNDTVLITVGWAYNDGSYYSALNFGDPTDPIPSSNTGITTFIGYYARILSVLQEAAPGAMVILVTGYGTPYNSEGHKGDILFTYEYTFADGKKTTKEMYDALEAMANHYGFSCINQAKGGVINRINANYLIGDNIHPTYDNYRVYGNFLASRIVSMFQNL